MKVNEKRKAVISLDQLKELVSAVENCAEYRNGKKYIVLSIAGDKVSGERIIIEQPSEYAECNSTYYLNN